MIALKCNLPDGWKLVPLAELCEINPTKPRGFGRTADAPTTFIPMEAVDDKTGAVISPVVRPYSTIARGYTYFEEGDVIFAKITPCMQNGKIAILTGLLDGIGFGSTEFHVFRAKPGVDSRWMYHLLRSAEFRRKAEENFEGSAGQRRVPEHFLEDVHVPFQEDRNARDSSTNRLDEAMRVLYRMRTASERQFEASSALPNGELRNVFSLSELPDGWILRPIGELVRADGQQIDSREAEFATLPFLGLENIESGTGRFVIPENQAEPGKGACFRFGPQHVLYGKLRPYLNKVYLPDNNGRCALEILPLLPCAGFSREFVAAVLRSPPVVAYTTKHSTGGRMPRADIRKLMRFEVAMPATPDACNILGGQLNLRLTSFTSTHAAVARQREAVSALPRATLRQFFNLT